MDKKHNSEQYLRKLKKAYPQAKIALNYNNTWQLMVATILSAQCTDARVNIITEQLFTEYPNFSDYINLRKDILIKYIRSAGFYNNKAKNILASAKILHIQYNGKIPDSMKELVKLPGVARKTANVILHNAFGKAEGIAVDTHVNRLSYRLDLSTTLKPNKTELELMEIYPKKQWISINHLFIAHGRAICKARNPECTKCMLDKICPKKGLAQSKFTS